MWCLVYGAEWKEVREHALETLTEWHQECPHKWPLTGLMDAWELTLTHSLSPIHSPTHSLTLSLTLTHYHSLSHTLTHSHSRSLTLTHSHSLSLTLTHSLE